MSDINEKANSFLSSLRGEGSSGSSSLFGQKAPPSQAAPPPAPAPASAPAPDVKPLIDGLQKRLDELEKKLTAQAAEERKALAAMDELRKQTDSAKYRLDKLQESGAPFDTGPESEGTVRRLVAQMSGKWLVEGEKRRQTDADTHAALLDIKDRLQSAEEYLVRFRDNNVDAELDAQRQMVEKARQRVVFLQEQLERGLSDQASLKVQLAKLIEQVEGHAKEIAAIRLRSEQQIEAHRAKTNDDLERGLRKLETDFVSVILDLKDRLTWTQDQLAQTQNYTDAVFLKDLERRVYRIDARVTALGHPAAPASVPALPATPAPPSGAEPAYYPQPPYFFAPSHQRVDPSDPAQEQIRELQKQLSESREEALKMKIVLREREEAQKQAQAEVEKMFQSMRERSRMTIWDAALREQYSKSQDTITRLEARIRELEQRKGPESASAQAPFVAPMPESKADVELDAPSSPEASRYMELLMARMADLERRLEETLGKREEDEKLRRKALEDIQSTLKTAEGRWKSPPGGARTMAEGALETLSQALKERDELSAETGRILQQMQEEPEGSPALAEQRARLEYATARMKEIQYLLDKNMSLVQAWLQEGASS